MKTHLYRLRTGCISIFLFNSIDKSVAQRLDDTMRAMQPVLLVVNYR
jgi:hypothetical protein